jgi:nucleoside-diphosphate-sugar epimerase
MKIYIMIEINDNFKKFMVTGGCGFIGSHICEELLKQNKTVICIDNMVNCDIKNIEPFLQYNNFIFIKDDIRNLNQDKYTYLFDNLDIIFHEACGKCTVCMIEPQLDLLVNAWGTFVLLELAVKYNIKKFIHASTGSVYGEPVNFPTDENHILKPTSYYGVSKLAGERYVEVFGNMYGLNYSILRYFHVYGSRQVSSDYGGVVAIFIRKCLENKPITIYGTGEQLRSFTYVKDIVNINFLCVVNRNTDREIYNACSGIQVSINYLANLIKKNMNQINLKTIYNDWKKGDIKYFNVSNEKIKKLGIEFKTNFDEIIIELINEYTIYLK